MRAAAALAIAIVGAPAPAAAVQMPPAGTQVDTFVASSRVATERYRDQAAALADGYRPIGPDFPTMGEHWLSIALVVRQEVDPLHPPILEYVTIAGRPVLAGVAYTQLVRGELAPTSVPAPSDAWHFHQGKVDEESFILSHAGGSAGAGHDPAGPRIGVLHAWLWLENPAGMFATDNWVLPWYRLGLTPPAWGDVASPAALAVALASGGDRYFATLLRLREHLTPDQGRRVAEVLEGHARGLRAMILDERAAPDAHVEAELGRAWSAVEADLRVICDACSLLEPEHRHGK